LAVVSRIANLPRRDWRVDAAPYVEPLSALLRAPGGEQTLRLPQASALLELGTYGGTVLQGRVGIGKTLVLAAGPRVCNATRPLILTLGGIKKETHNHFVKLRKHWQLPIETILASYTDISNFPRLGKSLDTMWAAGGPNFIGCDEMDKLSNLGAAVTGQINEYLEAYPETHFMGATGSCDRNGVLSYWHIANWALRERSPLPRSPEDADAWAEVIDRAEMGRRGWVCHDLGISKESGLREIRAAYRSRLHSAPGFIVEDSPFDGVPLTFASRMIDIGLEEEYTRLRELGQRPDGLDVLPDDGTEDDTQEAIQVDRVANGNISEVARQFGRGFFYKCDPLPPIEWMAARRGYFSYVRRQLAAGAFYTEAQVRQDAETRGVPAWTHWRDVKPTFVPQYRTVWLSSKALEACAAWGAEVGSGVIWTEHPAFGLELERHTGWTYYGGRGLSRSGKYIENDPGGMIIASRRANSVGRNLQYKWHTCLFSQPVTKAGDLEQGAGRFHREDQIHPVHCDVLIACSEDMHAVAKSRSEGKRTQECIYSQKAAMNPWAHVGWPDPLTPAFS
jgi:hypothetical protein